VAVNEIEAAGLLFLFYPSMEVQDIQKVVEQAARDRGCTVVEIKGDDDNNFDITIDKAEGSVDLQDCEYVHRAVLDAFDRDIEDYSLTVGSKGISAEEAEALLSEEE